MLDSSDRFIFILNRIETVNFGLGIVFSCILLLCIIFKTNKDIGTFKYLQIIFVLTDVSYSIAAFILDEVGSNLVTERSNFWMSEDRIPFSPLTPLNLMRARIQKVITHGYKFCLITLGADNLISVCIYCTFFCAIILIVAVNFLYRLWAVTRPEKIRLFSEKWFISVITLTVVCLLNTWFFSSYFLYEASADSRRELVPQLREKYGLDAMNRAMIVGDYFRAGRYNVVPLLGLAIFTGIIAGVILFMIYSSIAIVSHLRDSKMMSKKTRKLQIALFRMLACQTAVPVILVHGCAGAQLFVPLTGLNIELYSDISTVFLSFFTPVDALVVILLIRDYREAVWDIATFNRRKVSKVEAKVSTHSTAISKHYKG